MNMALTLKFAVGVTPKPYFGGPFGGPRCQQIARRLSAIEDLFAAYAPPADVAAYREACTTWAELLPVLTRTRDSTPAKGAAFRAGAARFVDRLRAAFPWVSVSPKLHILCCHATDFLDFFGSLGRYSEQALESWHGHFNQTASLNPSENVLSSCLSYVRRSAVSRAPGDDALNRGRKRSPAKAGPGGHDAKGPQDKRTKTGRPTENN